MHLQNLEIIHIRTSDEGELLATLSYRDPKVEDLNDGYSTIEVPVNMRPLQTSIRGNILVNQSNQGEVMPDDSEWRKENWNKGIGSEINKQ